MMKRCDKPDTLLRSIVRFFSNITDIFFEKGGTFVAFV